MFRIVWFENNDLKRRKPQILRFTRHVWGINSSPYVTLVALKRFKVENPANASQVTLRAIEHNMDNLLLSSDFLIELKQITSESNLFRKPRI